MNMKAVIMTVENVFVWKVFAYSVVPQGINLEINFASAK